MAAVAYRFAGIPRGVVASVESVAAPGVQVTTVTGGAGGYGDANLAVGDYVAIYRDLGYTYRVAGDLASAADVDYSRSAPSAAAVPFSNTASGLTATTVQAALDEVVVRVAALEV